MTIKETLRKVCDEISERKAAMGPGRALAKVMHDQGGHELIVTTPGVWRYASFTANHAPLLVHFMTYWLTSFDEDLAENLAEAIDEAREKGLLL